MIKGKINLIIQSKPEDEEERSKRELQIDCYFEVLGQAWPHNPTTQGKPQPTEHWPIEKSHWICCHCVILVLFNAVWLWLQMNTPQSFVVCCVNPFLNMCGKSSSVYWNPYSSLLNGKSLGIWNNKNTNERRSQVQNTRLQLPVYFRTSAEKKLNPYVPSHHCMDEI